MRLETAYRREWYMIVQEECRDRKRRRIFVRRSAVMVSKGSSTPVMETPPATRPATTDGPNLLASRSLQHRTRGCLAQATLLSTVFHHQFPLHYVFPRRTKFKSPKTGFRPMCPSSANG